MERGPGPARSRPSKASDAARSAGGRDTRACSFVSGEAASVFVPFYAAALILSRWSLLLASAGTVGGLGAGMIRVSQGAHFLSDVIFAGVLMALTVLIVHGLTFGQHRGRTVSPS